TLSNLSSLQVQLPRALLVPPPGPTCSALLSPALRCARGSGETLPFFPQAVRLHLLVREHCAWRCDLFTSRSALMSAQGSADRYLIAVLSSRGPSPSRSAHLCNHTAHSANEQNGVGLARYFGASGANSAARG